jgi:hypothetical protein
MFIKVDANALSGIRTGFKGGKKKPPALNMLGQAWPIVASLPFPGPYAAALPAPGRGARLAGGNQAANGSCSTTRQQKGQKNNRFKKNPLLSI